MQHESVAGISSQSLQTSRKNPVRDMSKSKLMAFALVLAITVPAGFILVSQLSAEELMQLDMTLKLQSTSDDMEFRAKYHWGADEIETSVGTSNVKWRSRAARATVESSDNLTSEIRSYFSEITIESDYFTISRDGSWSLSLEKKLCQGVYMNVDVDGDNTTVTRVIPSLSVSLVPASLANALRSVGVDTVNVVVTISVNIMGKIIEQYFDNCFSIFMDYVRLVKEVIDVMIGTISAI